MSREPSWPWVGLRRGWSLGLGTRQGEGRSVGSGDRLTVMAGREVALSSVRTLSQLEVPGRPGLGGASRSEESPRDQHLLSCWKAQWLLMVHCSSSSESSFWGGSHRVTSEKSSPQAPFVPPRSASKLLGGFEVKGPAFGWRTCPRRHQNKPGVRDGAQMDGNGHLINLISPCFTDRENPDPQMRSHLPKVIQWHAVSQ